MNQSKLALNTIRNLSVLTPNGEKFICAASGLVKHENNLYVIADDELSLMTFSLKNKSPGHSIALFPGILPTEPKARKKVKPDLECLAYIPANLGQEGLLAIPSGSKPNRQIGSFVKLQNGQAFEPKKIDFSLIYETLQKEFLELNIEGAALSSSSFVILQRGNGASAQSALIELDILGLADDLQNNEFIQASRIKQIKEVCLGNINNINLGFTDACFCNNKLFFLAVAESGNSTYNDGQYVGAFIGYFDNAGKAVLISQLDSAFKPEGLWVEGIDSGYRAYIVTDADDPNLVSTLFSTDFKF